MNLQSILLLTIVLLSALIALRVYIKRYAPSRGCGSCSGCDGCSGCALRSQLQANKQ